MNRAPALIAAAALGLAGCAGGGGGGGCYGGGGYYYDDAFYDPWDSSFRYGVYDTHVDLDDVDVDIDRPDRPLLPSGGVERPIRPPGGVDRPSGDLSARPGGGRTMGGGGFGGGGRRG